MVDNVRCSEAPINVGELGEKPPHMLNSLRPGDDHVPGVGAVETRVIGKAEFVGVCPKQASVEVAAKNNTQRGAFTVAFSRGYTRNDMCGIPELNR